jgi:hypothetical protein
VRSGAVVPSAVNNKVNSGKSRVFVTVHMAAFFSYREIWET